MQKDELISSTLETLEDFSDYLHFTSEVLKPASRAKKALAQTVEIVWKIGRRRWPEQRKAIAAHLIQYVDALSIPELAFNFGLPKTSIASIVSFRELMTLRSARRSLAAPTSLDEWELGPKLKGYSFVDQLGIKRPIVHSGSKNIANLDIREACVVKPVHGCGSTSVYLVNSKSSITRLAPRQRLHSLAELHEALQEDIRIGRVKTDAWIVEQLLGSEKKPAIDVKFWCFYGKAEIAYKMIRLPELRWGWCDRSGNAIETGQNYIKRTCDGSGIPDTYFELAERLSLAIPAPFMRIDFIDHHGELYFNEFTPRPGTYHDFNKEYDSRLGIEFLSAEARLLEDLYSGKRFPEFMQVQRSHA